MLLPATSLCPLTRPNPIQADPLEIQLHAGTFFISDICPLSALHNRTIGKCEINRGVVGSRR